MKLCMMFALLVLALSAAPAAGAVPAAAGVRAPSATAAAPCDSVSDNPFAGEMLLFNVSINGGAHTGTVAANDSFTVSFDYSIHVCEAPTSNNFCQVVVGFASSAQPLFCVFRNRVDCTGENGALTFRMKAPAYPSEYLIAFDLQRTLTELPCPSGWPQGPPAPDRYLACVTVTAGNLPLPLTGGVDNVTASSATLHGTVNPAGAVTTARFLVGTAPGAYTDSVEAAESPVSGSAALAVSAPLAGLSGNTRYYYRATAESENGYNNGEENSFFTGPLFVTDEAVHSFGHLGLNETRTDSVLIRNAGNIPLQVTSVIPLSGQYFASPASATIGPAGSRKFAVTFSPPAYGSYNSGIVFVHTGVTTPDTQLVRGDVPIGGVLAGWNIVSVPLTVADPRTTVVFPAAVSSAYEYASGYVTRDTVRNGLGYWLKYPARDSMVVSGDVRENESVSVAAGWNMIGGPSLAVPLDSITSTPPGIIAGNFFEYAAGYAPVSLLRPGKGYWVKVSQAGTLGLRGQVAGGPTPAATRGVEGYDGAPLIVTDAEGRTLRLYVAAPGAPGGAAADPGLPPPPPGGAFDVRFGGDRIVSRVTAGEMTPIFISGARDPVTISWPAAIAGGALFVDGAPALLDAPGSVTIAGETAVGLGAAPAGPGDDPRPRGYGLSGNYPNPFNPSTAIRFELAAAGEAKLSVYNAIGELVAVLVDGPISAGMHTVVFDAAGLPGGVYFCRLFSAGGASTARMLLVK
jgi:hypothetical protein